LGNTGHLWLYVGGSRYRTSMHLGRPVERRQHYEFFCFVFYLNKGSEKRNPEWTILKPQTL